MINNPYSSCHLGFNAICATVPTKEEYDFSCGEYEELRSFINSALEEYRKFDLSITRAFNAYDFVKIYGVDKGLASFLSDTFALEEITGIPRNCLSSAPTVVCLEGLGSFIINVVKRIIEFFKKLYETIMRFLGIKTFRQRRIEKDLDTIKRKVENMSDIEFKGIIKQNIKCNVSTMSLVELDRFIEDIGSIYGLLVQHKDTNDIKALVSATSGMLTQIGFKTVDEYKIVADKGLPYKDFNSNVTLNIENDFGIKDRMDIVSRIHSINEILSTLTDIRRWYPANLQKYASRAQNIQIDPNDPRTIELHEESIRKLNEEQKCQAYMCKYIVIYLEFVDTLCARAIATFGTVTK